MSGTAPCKKTLASLLRVSICCPEYASQKRLHPGQRPGALRGGVGDRRQALSQIYLSRTGVLCLRVSVSAALFLSLSFSLVSGGGSRPPRGAQRAERERRVSRAAQPDSASAVEPHQSLLRRDRKTDTHMREADVEQTPPPCMVLVTVTKLNGEVVLGKCKLRSPGSVAHLKRSTRLRFASG